MLNHGFGFTAAHGKTRLRRVRRSRFGPSAACFFMSILLFGFVAAVSDRIGPENSPIVLNWLILFGGGFAFATVVLLITAVTTDETLSEESTYGQWSLPLGVSFVLAFAVAPALDLRHAEHVVILVILLCLSITPSTLYFVFLASRQESAFNGFVRSLRDLGLLTKRRYRSGTAESDEQWEFRIRGYVERYVGHYGVLPQRALRHYRALAIEALKATGEGRDVSLVFDEQLENRLSRLSTNFTLMAPILASTILITAGWVYTLLAGGYEASWRMIQLPDSPKAEGPLLRATPSPEAFGFLGAYFFSLQLLVRRFLTRSLGPNAYATASLRILLGIVAGWVVGVLVPHDGVALVVAFAVGVFPPVLFQLVAEFMEDRLGRRFTRIVPSLPLTRLKGLSVWHEVRLEEEDIDNVQNMATADIVQLLLSTRMSPHRIVDWIDQAILLSQLEEIGPPMEPHGDDKSLDDDDYEPTFRWTLLNEINRVGIDTATALVEIVRRSIPNILQDATSRSSDRPVLTKAQAQLLLPLAIQILQTPNYRLIANWRDSHA